MRILFISAFPPNGMTAGQSYSRNLINDLSQEHEVELIYFDYPDHKLDIYPIKKVKRKKTNGILKLINCIKLPFVHPFFSSRFSFRVWFYILLNARKFDILYLDFSQVFIYNFLVKSKVVLMSHDVIYQKYSRRNRIHDKLFASLLKFWEGFLIKRGNPVLTFSDKDVELIQGYYNVEATRVDFYISNDIKNIDYEKIEITEQFCFFGAWNRRENSDGLIWFINHVLPSLDNLKFTILGGGMPASVVAKIERNPNLVFLGYVDNPYKFIAASQALIAPLFDGAGVKVKVLESLCCGTDVIGTDVALEGIPGYDINSHLVLCKNADDFINKIRGFRFKTKSYKLKLREKFIYPNRVAKELLKA